MKLVVQRVSNAQVSVHESGDVVGHIEKGLFVLVGFKEGDTDTQVRSLASKLLKLRIMSDKEGKMNYSITDVSGQLLIVSQFTLYADTEGGNRPSFLESLTPQLARQLYGLFIDILYEAGITVATGSFGNYMDIKLQLDGPVTILLEETA